MNDILQRILQSEKDSLSPYAQLAVNTKGRAVFQEDCPLRTAYQRDRDRIIHSKSFRRLKQKTQVFISPQGDHYRTRLTHTLEVTQIARTIARALKLNEDLCEAIALGHDLGHTPFGHAGERALNNLNPKGFMHHKQSVRIVTYLENNLSGLNLTYEVIDGIENHSGNLLAQTLEGRIVNHADRIAYINHDIEDAISAGILNEEDLPISARELLGNTKSKRITTLITDMVKNSDTDIKFSKDVETQHNILRNFMHQNVYTNSVAKTEECKVDKVIEELYKYYLKNTDTLPNIYKIIANNEGADQGVTDYIQGMSDDFAIKTFEDIFVPKSWIVK